MFDGAELGPGEAGQIAPGQISPGQVAQAGDWVQVHAVLLHPGERAPGIPAQTAAVPLEARIRGFLAQEKVQLGQLATVRTRAGHMVVGRLEAIRPVYEHDFGEPVPELLPIGPELRRLLDEG